MRKGYSRKQETGREQAEGMPAMKQSFPAHATSLREVRAFIRDHAREAALHEQNAEDLVQAVSEVCANVVQHAEGDRFVVSWKASPGEPAEVMVRDEGVFASKGMAHRGTSRGFGLPLVAALVDELSIVSGTPARPGTVVSLVKYRGGKNAAYRLPRS